MNLLSSRLILIPVAAIGLGFADIALRILLLAGNNGWAEVAHDPGKHLFHILLLPFVLLLLVGAAPRAIIAGLNGVKLKASLVFLSVLACLAVWFTLQESQDSFFNRLTTPEDIRSGEKRAELEKFRMELWSDVKREQIKPRDASDSARKKAHSVLSSEGTHTFAFIQQASLRRATASLSALLANLTCAFVFWLVLIVPVAGAGLSESGRRFFLVVIGALTLWIPLKMYSEWHHNFGYFPADDNAMSVGALLSLVAVFLVIVFRSESVLFTISSGSVAALSLITYGIFGQFPDRFTPFARFFADAKPFVLITSYFIIFTASISYAIFLLKRIDLERT